MFDKPYETQLKLWCDFRSKLEDLADPFGAVIDFYKSSPYTRIQADPWDKTTWPTGWELLKENLYCDFCRVLGWYYSLQLTERFSDSNFEIHIITAEEKSYRYLLLVDEYVLGISDDDKVIKKQQLPINYQPQTTYSM